MLHAAGGVQEGEDRTGPASIAFDSGEVTGDFEEAFSVRQGWKPI